MKDRHEALGAIGAAVMYMWVILLCMGLAKLAVAVILWIERVAW